MKSLSVLAVLLATSTPLMAAEPEYFGAPVACEEPGFLNVSTAENGNQTDLVVWYFAPTQSRYSGSAGTADLQNGVRLNAGNLNIALEKTNQRLSAGVVKYNGSPAEGCSFFDLEKLTPPLERLEAYLSQIESAAFTPEDARKISEAALSVPPVEMLPDLDRQIFAERRQTTETTYWQGFAEARQKYITEAPVDDSYAETAYAFLDFDLGPNGSVLGEYNALGRLKEDIEMVAGRLADAGQDPRQALASTELACSRGYQIFKVDPYGDRSRHLVIASRLPFAFWDRDIAQQMLDGMRSCKADTSAKWIADNFPAIMKEGERREAIQAEVARLAALPPTLETLLATDGLKPSQDFAREWKMDVRSIEKAAGTSLTAAREKAYAAVEAEVVAAAMEQISTGRAYDANSACSAALDHNWALSEMLLQPCVEATQAAIETQRQEQATKTLDRMLEIAGNLESLDLAQAREASWFVFPTVLDREQLGEARMAEIETALQAAREKTSELMLSGLEKAIAESPGEEIQEACEMASGMEQAYGAVIQQCRNLIEKHNQGVRTAQCDKRVEEAGATKIQDDMFELQIPFSQPKRIDIRELACDPHTAVQFAKSGWFGGGMNMTLTADGDPITAVISRTEEGDKGIWRVTEVEGFTPPNGQSPALCLLDRNSCTRTQ